MAERLSLYFPPEMLPKVEQQAVAYDADHAIAKFCRLTGIYENERKINSLFNDNK